MQYQRNAADYLINTAARLPDKLAFADDGVGYTFGELLEYSRVLGQKIYDLTRRTGERIAVITDRTAASLLGCFSATMAGSCYVPIDKKMPRDRMLGMLDEISPAVILYSRKDEKLAAQIVGETPAICIEDGITGTYSAELLEAVRERVLDVDPVYMIFTSGSTGKPKGIPISHRSLIDFTEWMSEFCGVRESDILGNQAPFYFDLSVKDIYQTLKNGCSTYILPKKLFMFPTLLVDYLNNRGVTVLFWATSAFRLVADSGIFEKKSLPNIRMAALGGEALLAKHVNEWKKGAPSAEIINLYGPTEVTVDCTAYRLERDFEDGEPIPIGKACANMEILLLDEELREVADGERGEICVRGAGIALGYFADKNKTNAAFIQNPTNPYYRDILYRTGDIAKKLPDGNLLFLSRRDNQIKHMGYRIELGDIETALSGIDGAGDAVCFFDEADDAVVCCAVTALTAAQLTAQLKEKLPKYMIPNVWQIMTSLPMNANGKIDRVKLKNDYLASKSAESRENS